MERVQGLVDWAWTFVSGNYQPVLAALIILVVGRLAAGWVRRLLGKGLHRSNVDDTLIPFLTKLAYYAVITVTVIAALNRIGVATTSVVAIFGAAGLAIGLALQGTLSNFAAGVLLLVRRPFGLGDFVEAGGTSGVVMEIGVFATTLRTGDNIMIVVPNSQILGGNITNYNGYDTRRVDLTVGISYDDDIQLAVDTINKILAGHDQVLADPAPQVAVSNLGDSSVDLVVRPWCRSEDYWGLRFDLIRSLKEGLEGAGCSLPYPQRDVHMHQVAS